MKTDEQPAIRRGKADHLAPYQYKKGQTGNSLGRYMGGISGKERLKRKIMGMNDEEFEEWCNGMNKIELFKMAEGNPKQDNEHTGKDGGEIKGSWTVTFKDGNPIPD